MTMHYHDRKFIQRYKASLKRFGTLNELRDTAFSADDEWNQFTDLELEQFKNCFGQSYVTRDSESGYPRKLFRNAFQPRLNELGSHLNPDDDLTLFSFATAWSDGLLLLLGDVDNKQGTGDVERATKRLVEHYGFHSSFVEPSTHGKGRHVYFVLDIAVTGVSFFDGRKDIWKTFEQFTAIIKTDPIWKETGCTFDGFYGLPTIWTKDHVGHKVEQRGNGLKMPRMAQGEADLKSLNSLVPQSLERLQDWLRADAIGVVTPRTATRVIKETEAGSAVAVSRSDLRGYAKKTACVGYMLNKTNGQVTDAEVTNEYMDNWSPTTEGDTASDRKRRIRELTTCLKKMRPKHRPKKDDRLYPFQRDQFLSVVEATVDQNEYEWSRREVLNHQKMSDFVSMKIGDAFFAGNTAYFAMTSRDTTIQNSRTLKEQKKLDWIVNGHMYKKLLDIAVKNDLLEVFDSAQKPIRDPSGKKIVKGHARQIGPGKALQAVRNEWLPLFNKWKATKPVTLKGVA